MAGKIKPLPKILAGIIVVGGAAWYGWGHLDKLPPPQIVTPVTSPAPIASTPVEPHIMQTQQPPIPQPQAVEPRKADALDALIHESGKK